MITSLCLPSAVNAFARPAASDKLHSTTQRINAVRFMVGPSPMGFRSRPDDNQPHPRPRPAQNDNELLSARYLLRPSFPSLGTPGEASGVGDCPLAGRGGGSLGSISSHSNPRAADNLEIGR